MSKRLKGLLLAVSLCVQMPFLHAAGPKDVAKADFSLWPHPVSNPSAFNKASRADLIVSALILDEYSQSSLKNTDLGIKSIKPESVSRWKLLAKQEWLTNFEDASSDCQPGELACGFEGGEWSQFVEYAKQIQSDELKKALYEDWLDNTQRFYRTYLKEQYRLAALFPSPSSEISKLKSSEVLGNEFKDRHFMLSFDDGPTSGTGVTERYVDLLDHNGISAYFFVLGTALEKRLVTTPAEKLRKVYWNQCLASHGYNHKPHPRLTDWQESIEKTNDLIHQVATENRSAMFRPPYGQRMREMVDYLDNEGSSVILWNIDSQDWSNKISANEVASRIKKLMLVKRRGIVLFHDVHTKGLSALPEIIDFASRVGLSWLDCHEVSSLTSTSHRD